MSLDEWDGPTLDEEIEDLENEGFVVFAPERAKGRNSLEEARCIIAAYGYDIVYTGKP